MFLAFRAAGAKDWTSNLQISLDQSGSQHRLQFHHFFPKALLTKNGFTSRDADDIANLTFISGRTNHKISDKNTLVRLDDQVIEVAYSGLGFASHHLDAQGSTLTKV